jgi:pimeloyl-ACP methyl ester carboxylesterase
MTIFKKVLKILGIIALSLIVLIFIFMRLIMPSFFKDEAAQTKVIIEQGQIAPTFETYTVGEQMIHYTQVGDTSKPLVIFVHGSPGSSDAFLDFLADTTLSEICQMISVDRPGFGASSGKGETSLARQSEVLKPIVEKYAGKKIVLVGHSLGGPVIARMAMDYEELLTGLIIVAGSIDPTLEPNEWFRPALKYPPLKWFMNDDFEASNTEIMPLESELEAMMPLWEKITIPVTVIQGTEDKLVPAGNADFAKKMLVNSQKAEIQMIEKANHFVLWSQPELTKQAIATLLR